MEALRLMQDGGFDHVPVVDDDRAVGIVSHRHFCGLEQTRLTRASAWRGDHARLEEETRSFETLR
jgi:predicted transcriptional regulator